MYVEIQRGLLLFHRKHLSIVRWAMTRLLLTMSMAVRTLWWTAGAWLGIGTRSAHKAKQSAAATRFHLTGKEPNG